MNAENFYFEKYRNTLLSDVDSVAFPLGGFSHKGTRIQGLFRINKCQGFLAFSNGTVKKMIGDFNLLVIVEFLKPKES